MNDPIVLAELFSSLAIGTASAVLFYRRMRTPAVPRGKEPGHAAFLRGLLEQTGEGLRGVRGTVRSAAQTQSPGGAKCTSYFSATVQYPTLEDGTPYEAQETYKPCYDMPGFVIENDHEVCHVMLAGNDFLLPDDPEFRPDILNKEIIEYHVQPGDNVFVFGQIQEETGATDAYRSEGKKLLRMRATTIEEWDAIGSRSLPDWHFSSRLERKLSAVSTRPRIRFIRASGFDTYVPPLIAAVHSTRRRELCNVLLVVGLVGLLGMTLPFSCMIWLTAG